MNQSVLIFGALIFLFVVFVTMKGQLPTYLAILGLAPKSNLPSSKSSSSTSAQPGPLTLATTGVSTLPALATLASDADLFSTVVGA